MHHTAAMTALPPITQLRPLHTLQHLSTQEPEAPSSSPQQMLHWASSFKSISDEDTVIKAFVTLVSRVVALDAGEGFCIQDAARGGFILAHAAGADYDVSFAHIDCAADDEIPTDFSIGDGKALQLHFDAETRRVRLAAQAQVIPAAALKALGHMLDDLLSSLQQGQVHARDLRWTQPSVLNFPPRSRPLDLFSQTSSYSECLEQTYNKPPTEEPALLHRWFEQRVAECPGKIALDFLVCLESGKTKQYTYQQVENAANALAVELLRTCALRNSSKSSSLPGVSAVAVLMGPCPELYITYLAALKAGMAFCPIPVDAPRERQDALMADLKPAAVLVTSPTQPRPTAAPLINVESFVAGCNNDCKRPTLSSSSSLTTTATDAAYILYTSGTTGMPKGVAISHISAACTISALSEKYGLVSPKLSPFSEPIRWFQGAAPTFDISLFEIFWTLSTGSTLCCSPREFTMQNIDKVLTSLKADMTNITPSFANLLDPSSISGLMLGGETLNPRLLRDFARYNPTARNGRGNVPSGIYNGYGPTETAIYCIAQAHVPADQRGSVLGTPLATCAILIVDERTSDPAQLGPVPMGAIGELVITGPQVSELGYVNRPNETARAFIDSERWGRAYRTGDRARIVWDPRGEPAVEFLGRISDDQVKLSGRRVELSEIESVLASKVAGVREVLACLWKQTSGAGSERIVCLVVAQPPDDLGFDILHQRCLEIANMHLPDYMRPFKILQVETLPRSASGKIDRKAGSAYVRDTLEQGCVMRRADPAGEENTSNTKSLQDPEDAKLEEKLLSMISDILGSGSFSSQSKISATTPLVDAGMDSLHAMRLLRDLRTMWPTLESSEHQIHRDRLQPSLAMLLNPKSCVRSIFFPSEENAGSLVKLDAEKKVRARGQLADFSSRHISEAMEKLGVASKADIEMVLPATCTQSQLALSFAMNRRNYISHSVLKLESGVSFEALTEAVEMVTSEQAIYRSAMLPCDDTLSPFAQVILTPDAWRRLPENADRVTHRRANPSQIAGDVKIWLDLAEANMSLESRKLYHIQIIEPESGSESHSSCTGLLVISIAHCICDGASLEVLMDDIARQYAGLESLPRQGIQEVVLEWALNVSPETDKLWQDSLKGWETEGMGALSGRNVQSCPTGTTHEHGTVHHVVDLPWQILEDKSRALGSSPLPVLQASWSLLLNLLSESDTGEITFGSVISGHHLSAHAPTFSVVPCRVALPVTQTISQLVKTLTNQSRVAQSHRHTSFGIFQSMPYNTALALQQYLPPDDTSLPAIPVPWTSITNPAIRYDFAIFAEVFPTDSHSDDRDGLFNNMIFKLTYREDVLSTSSAACLVKQFAALTEIMVSSVPNDLVQSLPARLPRSLLSAEGTVPRAIEDTAEDGRQSQDRHELLHSQFENQAALTPHRLALSFYTSLDSAPVELTYAELDAKANGLAMILREEDVDVIPICLQRSVELYVTILAILKAGSAWCPIDETSPVLRRTSLIARTRSKVLLTTTESLPLVEPCLAQEGLAGVRVLLVDQYTKHKTSVRPNPRRGILSSQQGLSGKDMAYLLWTSGTTGEPKGVMIQHSAAAQAMRDLQVQVEHDEKAEQVRTLQLSSYSFDVFVQDLFYTWGLAGSVISGTRELVLGTFVEFIWKSSPTHAHLTPSFGASIAVDEIKGSTLQYVTFIGEKLTEAVAEAWAAPGITTRAYNTYGPAENAVVSTMRRFYGKSRDQAKSANVGFPLNHCTAYVVREVSISPQQEKKRWELVPRYGVGELALGGAQVAKGYLANEAKTAKAFIQGGPGIDERIYLTGDIVRLNDFGFEFLGRNDDLVKIAGIRIELSEISAACASIKDVATAVEHVETLYLPRPGNETGSKNMVVVTFVSVKKETADLDHIRAQVFRRARDLLPAYMVPGHVVVLETTMPRTASNKVDRKALHEIYKASDLVIAAGANPGEQHTRNDEQTKSKWAEEQLPVLRTIAEGLNVAMEQLSQEDNLAGLGLNSLQVTKLAWLLRRQLKCAVGVLDLMRCQSLGELVEAAASQLPGQQPLPSDHNGVVSPPDTPASRSWVVSIKELLTSKLRGRMRPDDTLYVLPATPLQESLIVETMLVPRAYWAHRIFDLRDIGEVDVDRLKDAWTAVATAFDILRTVFVPLSQLEMSDTEEDSNSVVWARKKGIHSSVIQLIRAQPTVRWIQLCGDDQDLAKYAEELQMEMSPTTTSQPPWSVTYSERDNRMMLSMHHALYDGMSSEMLLNTVAAFYQKEKRDASNDVLQLDRGMELGILPTASQREEAGLMWKRRLEVLREEAGPFTAPFPDLTQSRQKQPQTILLSRRAIPPSLLAIGPGTPTTPVLFQSAFGCVLASYLETKAIVFGQTVSQRILHPDLDRFMGPAIATLPMIVRANSASAMQLWRDMSRDSSNILQHVHSLHPVDVKKMLNQVGGSSHAAFPGLFVYHPASETGEKHSARTTFREVGQALSLNVEHPLALNVFDIGGRIELTGDGRRISQAQLELMLDQIIDQARVMLESPHLPLDRLQNKMHDGLVSISGETAAEENGISDPTNRIRVHAYENPGWIAAEEIISKEFDGEESEDMVTKTITYAKLDRITNAIASKLTSHEACLQSDHIVALHMDRDIKSLAATLAIFRAGYVYLPVDTDLPRARKQLLFRDAKAKLIVTTEALARDLDLLGSDPPVLLLPDGDEDIETMFSWPVTQNQFAAGRGGYLLYTSGSTGRPKGVRVSNRNLCHFIDAFSTRLDEHAPNTADLKGTGKYLNLTSRAFDPHLTQLFVPWNLGHRVVIGKDRTAMLGNLQQIINSLGITHFGSVPSVLKQLGLRPENVPSVRVVTTGGEKASNELLDSWTNLTQEGQHQTQAILFNFYGPTEVTIGCLGHAVGRDSTARNLGSPLQGLQAMILCPNTDGEQQIVARRGQPGELCIAGPQVAMGYLDRPIENNKSFQGISVRGEEKRIYRTGDIMRMMHDGTLEFLGRVDQQAKIRGQRLELDEVVGFLKEAAADENDLDFAATVISMGNDEGSSQHQQLFGFAARNPRILLKAEAEAEAQLLLNPSEPLTSLLKRIEERCEADLPAFMLPTMVWVTKIPYLAASGKVDTKQLTVLAKDFLTSQESRQAHDSSAPAAAEDSGSTLSAKEQAVITAVEESLGTKVNNATATSRLHRLGIDSLSAVHLVSLLRNRGFSNLCMADIISSHCTIATVAELADGDLEPARTDTPISASHHRKMAADRLQEVKALSVSDLGPIPSDLGRLQIEAVLPCLPLQSALVARSLVWLSANGVDIEGKECVDIPYVSQFHYRLAHGTDLTRWKRAAELAVASEAMLRTCFVQRENDGRIFQVVLRSPPYSPFEVQARATDVVSQMNVRPPIRLHIQNTKDEDEVVIQLTIHHALFDGVAIDVLRRRLEQCYDGEGSIPASPSNSLDVLTRLSAYCYLSTEEMDSTRRSWQARLRGVRPCRVRTAGDSSPSSSMARSTAFFDFTTHELGAKLRDHSQQSGLSTSVSSAFQLAMALALARLTRQTSVGYGFVMSLRPLLGHLAEDVDHFVGPCLNTIHQTLSLYSRAETLPQLASRVHDIHIGSCEGAMPLVSVEEVRRWTESEEKLFDCLLSLNPVPEDAATDNDHEPGRLKGLDTRSNSDMALAVDIDLHGNRRIAMTLSSAGALTEMELEDLGKFFKKVVARAADETAKVGDFVSLDDNVNGAPGHDHDQAPAIVDHTTFSADEDHRDALSCVQTTLCRFLRLEPMAIANKSKASLYQIGLDSITVLPFVKLINRSECIKLTPDAVLRARNIQGVTRLVQEAKKIKNDTSPIGGERLKTPNEIAKDDMNDEERYYKTLGRVAMDLLFIATPLQEGMLSASLAIAGDAYTYVHTMQLFEYAIRADSPGLDKLLTAIQETVQSCEILRTRFLFTQDDEAPWIGVVSRTEQSDLVSWKLIDSGGLVNVEMKIHHALYDAASIETVWRVLSENYRRRLQGHEHDNGKAIVYLFRPFAKAVSLAQTASVEFWTNLVRGYSYTPLEFPEDSLQASTAFHFTLDEGELLLLQKRCRDIGTTTKAALQLAWAKVLCESLYGQSDVIYGEVVTTGGGLEGDDEVVGPTINTVPMRVQLADHGTVVNLAEALTRAQKLSDDARGVNAMASLRKVQALWRLSNREQEDAPASLFQSLFVFDGILDSPKPESMPSSPPLFRSVVGDQSHGTAFDDYPLVVSFHIKNNTLHGKVRYKTAKSKSTLENIGGRLENAVRYIMRGDAQSPVLDLPVETVTKVKVASNGRASSGNTDHRETDSTAGAILNVVKEVLGTRYRGEKLDYDQRLVNIGLDSILAIRLSTKLKRKLGMHVSVFEIIKGASIQDIIKMSKNTPRNVGKIEQRLCDQEQGMKELVVKKLGLSKDLIRSVLPILAGQRAHLEQWALNGKRFLEAPWVYEVVGCSLDAQKAASAWAELCRIQDVLRTTFVWMGDTAGLVQAVLSEKWTGQGRFRAIQDLSKPLQVLVDEHVSEENDRPSDLREPPARLSFLEASDGKAIVLRLHHALYDAWSIKMIEKDLNDIMAHGKVLRTHVPLERAVRSIRDIRQTDAEDSYWKDHLSHAQDAVLDLATAKDSTSTSATKSPLGAHFKVGYPAVVPRSTIEALSQSGGNARISAAIIVAYAKTLGHFTGRSRPTFGLNHASRSLSSADGSRALDLTDASVPTLTTTPCCVDLDPHTSAEAASEEHLFNFVQGHLAQLTKFAQADNLRRFCPQFNSNLNIIFRNSDTAGAVEDGDGQATKNVLRRLRLSEPLASNYFTATVPRSSADSTIEGLDTSHLSPHRIFFNILIDENREVSAAVSGDVALCGGDLSMVTAFVSHFGANMTAP